MATVLLTWWPTEIMAIEIVVIGAVLLAVSGSSKEILLLLIRFNQIRESDSFGGYRGPTGHRSCRFGVPERLLWAEK